MNESRPTPGLPVRILVTVLSASLLSLESAPINLHLLQWVGLVPMFWVVRPNTPRSNRWLGLLYGTVGVAVIFRWLVATIDIFSNLPLLLSVVILGLFSAAFGSPYVLLWWSVHPLRRRFGTWWTVAWPAMWVIVEFITAHLFLFPWSHGVAQFQVPLTFQVVGITGVLGVSFLIFFGNAVLGEFYFRWAEGDPEPPGFAALGFATSLLAVMLYGTVRYEAVERELREAPVLRVAQLQSKLSMSERLAMSAKRGFLEWIHWVEEIPPRSVDVVILPEGASPYPLNQYSSRENKAATKFKKLARHGHFGILVGGGRRVYNNGLELYNTVFFYGPDGKEVGFYDKMVPLPFGEYMPLSDYFPWVADYIGGIGNFKAGRNPEVFESDGVRYAAPICYEAILAPTTRSFYQPDFLVNVTNDAWFGDTDAPHQHGMLAAVRATELGVPVIRSAYAGVSFVVEPHGFAYAHTGLFVASQRLVEVRNKTFPTFYSRWGDWFVGLCAVFLFALEAQHRSRAPGS